MANEHEIKVGDSVKFRYGPGSRTGIVQEDRGPIGRGGRRLYLVKFYEDPGIESGIELPADQLEVQHPSLR